MSCALHSFLFSHRAMCLTLSLFHRSLRRVHSQSFVSALPQWQRLTACESNSGLERTKQSLDFRQIFPSSPFLSPSSLDLRSLHLSLTSPFEKRQSSSPSIQVRGALRSSATFTFLRFRFSASFLRFTHSRMSASTSTSPLGECSVWSEDGHSLRRMRQIWH